MWEGSRNSWSAVALSEACRLYLFSIRFLTRSCNGPNVRIERCCTLIIETRYTLTCYLLVQGTPSPGWCMAQPSHEFLALLLVVMVYCYVRTFNRRSLAAKITRARSACVERFLRCALRGVRYLSHFSFGFDVVVTHLVHLPPAM